MLSLFNNLGRFLSGDGQRADLGIDALFARFAGHLSDATELEMVIQQTMHFTGEILGVKRACVLLINAPVGANYVDLQPHKKVLGDVSLVNGRLYLDSPLYAHFTAHFYPLLQSEFETLPTLAELVEEEKAYFAGLKMHAYAPLVTQGKCLGILCAGDIPRQETYTKEDLGTLVTIGRQAGMAVYSARMESELNRYRTDAAQASEALRKTKAQLEQLDAVKTDFITIASHELRTPLAQIRGYSDIIEALNNQGILDPEQLKNMTGNLRKATNRMEDLIRNMLDVSQLDVDAMDLRPSQITIEHVIKMAIEPISESVRTRRQSLTARGLKGLPQIEADMKRLVQAFQNVIINAVKFTPDGGQIDIFGSLHKNTETGREEILVAISDTGIGIDERNKEIIFEKFVRAQDSSLHSTGKTKFMGAGPGLGLTIARGVIDGHGGRIWVESEGHDPQNLPGSTFYVTLPLKRPDTASGSMTLQQSSIEGGNLRDQLKKAIQAQQSTND
ncbi:MAG: ATP-binding protein [Anaerolineales bacterium]